MSNNFLYKYPTNDFNFKANTIESNYFKKIRYTKYNPYKPNKSKSLNKNSFYSLLSKLKNGNLLNKKSENLRGFNYGNLSVSTKYKERLNDSLISNSFNIINDSSRNRNISSNLTKNQWYSNSKIEEKNKELLLGNKENKIKERKNFYFSRISKKQNFELNKNYFNADFNLEEKNSGNNLNNYFRNRYPKPLEFKNLFMDESSNNISKFQLGFKKEKKSNDFFFQNNKNFNILPLIEKKQKININDSQSKIKYDEEDSFDSQINVEEIKNDIFLSDYFYDNCELIKNYAYKENPNIIYHLYMEDKSSSIINLNKDKSNSLFCLFDGHGGQEVSTYLQNNFHKFMKEFLPFYFENPSLFFSKLFKNIDIKLQNLNYYNVGSTASIIYIKRYNSKNYIYTANIGDSRIILIKTREFKRLSYDDRASDPQEFSRITKNGGLIIDNRVYGQLMLSRSFGDWELKKYGVICEPHVEEMEIGPNDLFIIMASDGVWDVLDEMEVYDMSSKIKNSKEYCDIIVNMAIEKGSTDNISCFVLQLN